MRISSNLVQPLKNAEKGRKLRIEDRGRTSANKIVEPLAEEPKSIVLNQMLWHHKHADVRLPRDKTLLGSSSVNKVAQHGRPTPTKGNHRVAQFISILTRSTDSPHTHTIYDDQSIKCWNVQWSTIYPELVCNPWNKNVKCKFLPIVCSRISVSRLMTGVYKSEAREIMHPNFKA